MRASWDPCDRPASRDERSLDLEIDLDALIAVVIEVSSEEERRPPHQHEDGDAAIRGSDRRDGRPSSSSAPRPRPVTWLRPGDCIDPASAENVTVEDLPVVPCGQPYDQEVIATRALGPGPWPDDAAINARSDKICTLEFALYIGIPDNQIALRPLLLSPNKQSWEVGDRTAQGMVSDSRGKTTGTLRGARRRPC
jgi:hypothetical protein